VIPAYGQQVRLSIVKWAWQFEQSRKPSLGSARAADIFDDHLVAAHGRPEEFALDDPAGV
jgi:hypothetical protein